MQARFIKHWRGRKPGDEVPQTYQPGLIASLVEQHLAEWVDDKQAKPARDKMARKASNK